MTPLTKALTLHLLLEFPASLSFLLQPRAQLPGASPDAVLVLRNLGGLLTATNLACLVLVVVGSGRGPAAAAIPERVMAMLCASLGTYHVWPAHRAWVRMRRRDGNGEAGGRRVLGGPVVHFWAHLLCLSAMLGTAGNVLMARA